MDDFEKRFFDLLQGDVAELKNDLKANTRATSDLAEHVREQNGRIGKNKGDIDKINKDLLSLKSSMQRRHMIPQVDNKTITLIALGAVILMIIIAYSIGAGGLVSEILK